MNIARAFKWLERKLFPLPTVDEYNSETVKQAQLELAKALDAVDFSNSIVQYRQAQLARILDNAK